MIDHQWTSGIIGIVIGLAIVWLVKKDHLSGRNALWWLTIAVIVPVIGIFPGIVDKLGSMLGINYPPILAAIIGMGLLLIKIILQDIELSRSETRCQRLAQRMAILESQLLQVRKNQQETHKRQRDHEAA